jgi:tetratricopeptide (TPR) repeat protein
LLHEKEVDPMHRRYSWIVAACAASAVSILLGRTTARGDSADDMISQTAPLRWVSAVDAKPLHYPAYFNDLDKAQANLSAGRYHAAYALALDAKLTKPTDQARRASIAAQALDPLGRSTEALNLLSVPAIANDPVVLLERAQVLAGQNRLAEALSDIHKLLALKPDSIAGHYWLGNLSEMAGDEPGALAAYTWFATDPHDYNKKWRNGEDDPAFDDAEQVTLIARGLDRWASMTENYKNNPDLNNQILNMFVKSYNEIDRDYWPAHTYAAAYFFAHDQQVEAGKELTQAIAANPHDPDSLNLAGMLSMQQYDFAGVEKAVDALRNVDPTSTAGDLLAARNYMAERVPEHALPLITGVLNKQPKNIEALGLLAACDALQLHDDLCGKVLAEVDALDPHNASAYMEVANSLSGMRQYDRSAAMYKIAIDRAPWSSDALTGIGLLYTQAGDEKAAGDWLEQAHELDPFNLEATNYLRLLTMMGTYKHVISSNGHFELIFDERSDPVLPYYMLDYLESVHDQICSTFHYEPKVSTLIEVFPTHEAFSVRTTGNSWIPTVGASTGRIIALVAPRTGEKMGTFNWADVLRHEYTHTVTLGETDNRIQHWLTEGLAVWEEQMPMRWEWVPMLNAAVKQHQLFPLDQLTWAFVRPKRPIDRQLAYAESYWIVCYVEEKYGHDTMLRMLADCRDAEPQEVFFPKETKRSPADFMTDFTAWCTKQVNGWGYDPATTLKYDALRKTAEDQVANKQYSAAIPTWEAIAKLRPVDKLPQERLAGLYLLTKNHDKALEHLIRLQQVELMNNRYAMRVARLMRDDKDWKGEAKYALDSVYINPSDIAAHELLAEADENLGNTDGETREKKVIAILNQQEEDAAKAGDTPAAPSGDAPSGAQ